MHVDCTQGVGKIELDLSYVDLISFAPHKFYGLNGFGGLIKKKDIVLEYLINIGASTTLYRSGTLVFLVMDPGYNPIINRPNRIEGQLAGITFIYLCIRRHRKGKYRSNRRINRTF